jgi:hypothetical protein
VKCRLINISVTKQLNIVLVSSGVFFAVERQSSFGQVDSHVLGSRERLSSTEHSAFSSDCVYRNSENVSGETSSTSNLATLADACCIVRQEYASCVCTDNLDLLCRVSVGCDNEMNVSDENNVEVLDQSLVNCCFEFDEQTVFAEEQSNNECNSVVDDQCVMFDDGFVGENQDEVDIYCDMLNDVADESIVPQLQTASGSRLMTATDADGDADVLSDVTVKLSIPRLNCSDINFEQLRILTGLHSMELFNVLLTQVTNIEKANCLVCRNASLSCADRLLMTLFKLRHNLNFNVLAIMWGVSDRTVSSYVKDMIMYLHTILSPCVFWPSKESVVNNLPKCFCKFKDTVVVLDCTEFEIESPRSLRSRILTYSHYYSCHTVKVLLGIVPSGMIIFVSKLFGGKASDNYITERSGVLTKCISHVDAAMVDKGFTVDKLCEGLGIKLYRPPFVKSKKQLSKADAIANQNIAAARVHVERAINPLKKFKILKDKVDLDTLPYLTEIVTICCALTNLAKPILANSRF